MTQPAPSSHGKPLREFAFAWPSGGHQYIACVPQRLIARSRFTETSLLLCVVTQGMFGQKSEPSATANIAQAVRVDRAPRLDGTLDDPIWQQACQITDFKQREPYEGQPATERTEVRIMYTRNEVHFGVECHVSSLNGPIAIRKDLLVTEEIAKSTDLRVTL